MFVLQVAMDWAPHINRESAVETYTQMCTNKGLQDYSAKIILCALTNDSEILGAPHPEPSIFNLQATRRNCFNVAGA